MKKLMMALSVVLMSMGMQLVKAQGVYELTGKAPFTIRFGQLSRYLDLQPSQQESVYRISEAFMADQQEALSRSARKEELMMRALHANLKQMKEALNEAQYRNYVTLLNVTSNNQVLSSNLTDGYLANNR